MPTTGAIGHSTSTTNNAADIEFADQLAERRPASEAELAHREGDGAEGADRRDLHDEADDLEQDMGHHSMPSTTGFPLRPPSAARPKANITEKNST